MFKFIRGFTPDLNQFDLNGKWLPPCYTKIDTNRFTSPNECCGARFETEPNTLDNTVRWDYPPRHEKQHTKGIRIIPGRAECFVHPNEKKTEISINGNILTLVTLKEHIRTEVPEQGSYTITEDSNDVDVMFPYFAWLYLDHQYRKDMKPLEYYLSYYKHTAYTEKIIRAWYDKYLNVGEEIIKSPWQFYILNETQIKPFRSFAKKHNLYIVYEEDGIVNANYNTDHNRLNIAIVGV